MVEFSTAPGRSEVAAGGETGDQRGGQRGRGGVGSQLVGFRDAVLNHAEDLGRILNLVDDLVSFIESLGQQIRFCRGLHQRLTQPDHAVEGLLSPDTVVQGLEQCAPGIDLLGDGLLELAGTLPLAGPARRFPEVAMRRQRVFHVVRRRTRIGAGAVVGQLQEVKALRLGLEPRHPA